MSAFIVSNNHINALVDLGLRGPAGCSNWFMVYYGDRHLRSDRANAVGSDLLKENYVSVNYRYHEKEIAPSLTRISAVSRRWKRSRR